MSFPRPPKSPLAVVVEDPDSRGRSGLFVAGVFVDDAHGEAAHLHALARSLNKALNNAALKEHAATFGVLLDALNAGGGEASVSARRVADAVGIELRQLPTLEIGARYEFDTKLLPRQVVRLIRFPGRFRLNQPLPPGEAVLVEAVVEPWPIGQRPNSGAVVPPLVAEALRRAFGAIDPPACTCNYDDSVLADARRREEMAAHAPLCAITRAAEGRTA